MTYHPLMINWQDKIITVIGGGKIAERKIKSYVGSGARITVVSPSVTEDLYQLILEKEVNWKEKHYERIDTEDAFYIIAATSNPALNERIIKNCKQNQLSLNVSNHQSSNTMMPAIIKRKNLQIAISTNGASPMLAKKIRDQIRKMIEAEGLDEEIANIAKQRRAIIAEEADQQVKEEKLHMITSRFSLE